MAEIVRVDTPGEEATEVLTPEEMRRAEVVREVVRTARSGRVVVGTPRRAPAPPRICSNCDPSRAGWCAACLGLHWHWADGCPPFPCPTNGLPCGRGGSHCTGCGRTPTEVSDAGYLSAASGHVDRLQSMSVGERVAQVRSLGKMLRRFCPEAADYLESYDEGGGR